jgi:hypothetical protein
MHGNRKKCIQNFDHKIWREETTWNTDERIILIWILKNQDVDWNYLVQDKDQCHAVVNMVMNLQFPKKGREFD